MKRFLTIFLALAVGIGLGITTDAIARTFASKVVYTSTVTYTGDVTNSGDQTNSGAVTFSSTVAHAGAVTNTGGLSVETGEFTYAGTAVTTTGVELNYSDGTVPGTAVASKVLALGANKNVDTIVVAQGGLKTGSGGGTSVKISTTLWLDGTLGNVTGTETNGVLIGKFTQTAAICFQDDGTVFTDYTSECVSGNGDIIFIPVVAEANDAFYIGHATQPFATVNIDTTSGVQGVTTLTVAHEYWDGDSWEVLTYGLQEVNDFDEAVGDYYNTFEPPSDWQSTTVNSTAGYYIRIRVATFSSSGTDATGDTITLGLTNSGDGINIPTAGLITETSWSAVTVSAGNNDSDFLLLNLSQGTHTVITYTKALKAGSDDPTDLAIGVGDQLLLMQLDEDGSTEYANVNLVLHLEI